MYLHVALVGLLDLPFALDGSANQLNVLCQRLVGRMGEVGSGGDILELISLFPGNDIPLRRFELSGILYPADRSTTYLLIRRRLATSSIE